MVAETKRPKLGALHSVEAGLHMHQRAQAKRAAASGERNPDALRAPGCAPVYVPRSNRGGTAPWWFCLPGRIAGPVSRFTRRRWVRRAGLGTAGALGVFLLVGATLWWRLSSGPISLDIITPWLTAAIAENVGNQFRVEVGGTVLERDEHGRAAMRIRDIKVRDRDGTVIASAPKAEVGLSSASLFSGSPRAERLNLVGAELAIRVESDGRVSVSTGSGQRPLATTARFGSGAPAGGAGRGPARAAPTSAACRRVSPPFSPGSTASARSVSTAAISPKSVSRAATWWSTIVRNGHQSKFENIHLSLTRPHAGELDFKLGSEDASRPWLVQASVKPAGHGAREVSLDARSISLRDLLLALRVDGGQMEADGSISATLRGEFAADGTPQIAGGRLLMVKGEITDPNSPESRIPIDRAEMTLDWNNAQHALAMPFQLVSGGARFTLIAHAEAPRDPAGSWALGLTGGSVVLSPATPDEEPVLLNRIIVRGRLDPVAQRLNIEQAEASGKGIGIAMSGNLDFSTPDPRLAIGLATRNISLAAFKQMWPPFINPPVRKWVMERVSGGVVEQGEIATNAPISTLRNGGPPVPDDGLSIQIVTNGTTVHPFDDLPEIRDADLVTRIKGRSATVTLGRGNVEMPSGRRLTMANGVFEVPETLGVHPPAKVRARIEGPVAAGVDLLSMDRLKDTVGVQLDPATSRGNILATLNMSLPLGAEIKNGTITYAINADIVNFSADRFLMSQKVEAQTLRAFANNQGYQIRGDMRIGGVPATAEMRRNSGDADAEVKLQATLDDAARNRLGWETAGSLVGPVTVKVGGRVDLGGDQENRLAVEADFTQAKIENLSPGLDQNAEPAGARDLHLRRKGKGGPLRGRDLRRRRRLDQGQRRDRYQWRSPHRQFPGVRDVRRRQGDARVERTPDNLYKAVMRGDVYDGRGFVKTSMSGSSTDSKQRRPGIDFDLDAKIGAIVGLKGEALRNVDLHLLRRGGTLRSLALNAKIGGDGNLTGEMRGRPGERQVVYHRIDRRRRAVPFHRHLFAHDRRADVDRDGPAEFGRHRAGRAPQCQRFHRAGGGRARSHRRRRAERPRTTACSSRACGWASTAPPARCRSARAWSAVP